MLFRCPCSKIHRISEAVHPQQSKLPAATLNGPEKGLGDLPREPNLRWVSGDLEMDDSPSMVIKYNHGIKHPKRRGRDHEHVE
jgi:hypothetical protein